MSSFRFGRPVWASTLSLFFLACVASPGSARAESIYLGLTNGVGMVATNGTGFTTIASNGAFVFGALSIDAPDQKLYFGDASSSGSHHLYQSNLDGSGLQTIATLDSGVLGAYADPASGKLYSGSGSALYVSNLDGTGKSTLLTGGLFGSVQVYNGKLYWDDTVNIYSANLDGTGKTTLVNGGSSSVTSITGLDVAGAQGKLIYGDQDHGTIKTANLDGTGVAQIASGFLPLGIAYDQFDGRVYFGVGSGLDSVNLDGSGFLSTTIAGNSSTILSVRIAPSAVPEPSSIVLSAAGLALVGLVARRRSRKDRPRG